jgi:CheY-like chemotaxis protein
MQCNSILIVEDDDSIRTTLKVALEVNGYTVFAATNGKEGLEELSNIPRPCLILLDLMMPVMDGWEFVAMVDETLALASIPVIVITAFRENARSIKAKEIIKKPVDLDILFDIVRQYCAPAKVAA